MESCWPLGGAMAKFDFGTIKHKPGNKQYQVNQAIYWSLAFSPDCQLLCSGSQDGTTRLWNLGSEQYDLILQPQRLYEDLNIMDAEGITSAQTKTLQNLGAKV